MNNVRKEEADYQVNDQVAIHEILEAWVISQEENEYIKAIYNTGEYRLSPPITIPLPLVHSNGQPQLTRKTITTYLKST